MTSKLICFIAPALALAACGGNDNNGPRKAYIGLFGDNAVAVVDIDAGKVLTTLPVTAPDGLVITPDGAKVYVSSNTTGMIDVIDTAKDQMATQIAAGVSPAGLAISPDGRYVVAAIQGDGKAAIIDTTTDAIIGGPAISKAHNTALSSDGLTAYIASQAAAAPSVDLVSVPGASVSATYAIDKAPRALCAAAGNLYVTVTGSDQIEVLNAATGALGTPITTGGMPHDIRPTLDGKQVLTVAQSAGELELIDPATGTITARVATGKTPHWISLSSDGKLAYVTNEGDNNMVSVDLATQKVVNTYAVGMGPRKIAVQP
jgi:YVTN family beta-propeller protein